ncbi:hypothetical protein [Sulfurimonas sp.]|uniref:hypothetical protein n=1 Tax=Sulfurimonas sp. TaxID=2022749 RepID=UPI003563006F
MKILDSNFKYIIKYGYEGYDPRLYYYLPFNKLAKFKPTFTNKVLRKLEKLVVKDLFPNLLIPYMKMCKIDAKTTIPYGLGQFLQAYIRLNELTKDNKYFDEAINVSDMLEKFLIKTEYGLGIPNPNNMGNTKFIDGVMDNSTIYLPGGSEVFFGYYKLYKHTNDKKYFHILNNIAESFINDFQIKQIAKDKVAFDYSNKKDNSHVLNANALVASALSIMYSETKNENYKDIALKTYNYIDNYLSYDSIPYAGTEDKMKNKSWNSCDTYHTGFTLRGMHTIAKIFNKDTDQVILNVKKMLDDFVIKEKIVVLKGKGQQGLSQDIHAVAEYIYIFALFYEYFDALEQKKYLEIISKNLDIFYQKKDGSYYYTVNKNKKFFLHMPRWSHAPMMNALSLLYSKIG